MRHLKLLGGLSIEGPDGPVTGRAAQRRRLALLALLATAKSGMSRERLIAFLWPEASSENGRAFLSDSVYRINQALGEEVISAPGDELRLDRTRLPSDVCELDAAVSAGDHERAVSLYAGEFLDGFSLPDAPEFERWSDAERTRLRLAHAESLEALAEAAEKRGDLLAASGWWRRVAALDPYSSRVALRLMEALDAAGERAGAIQHARIHEALLRGELELEPDEAVRAFADALRAERSPTVVAGPAPFAHDTQPGSVASGDRSAAAGEASRTERPPHRMQSGRVSRMPRRAIAAAAAVAALLLAVVVASPARLRTALGSALEPQDAPRSIAVLPFTSLGPDPADEYFGDGITEELIATLGRARELRVASRTSVFAYKDKALDVREVGRRLGVDAVIEGSVRQSGRHLRISAQLVSTSTGYTLWSNVYDRQLDDALAVQEEIARAMVETLLGRAASTRVAVARPQSTQSAEAYDLFLRARHAWHQRTRDGLLRAIELLERATDLAPEYARAHAGLADAYAVAAFYDYVAPRTAYPRAEAAARRAMRIDSTLAGPHATTGYILTYYHRDWSAAERSFQRALALDPGHSTAHQWYANLLTVMARFAEAERELRLAQEADPLSLIANAALGWSFYLSGRSSDALEQCRRTIALDSAYALAHLWGGWALASLERPDEARQWLERAVALSGNDELSRLSLAHLLASSSPDSARAMLSAVEQRADSGHYVPSYEIAKVHLALGDRTTALRWLARAVEERSHSVAFFDVDPQLAPLRGDPDFERLATAGYPSALPDRGGS